MKFTLNKDLVAIVFFVSFIISLGFIKGGIDEDFYAYLYVGRGVVEGGDMFKDFSENKGPVLYVVYSVLYYFFGYNYVGGLILFTALFDAVVVICWLFVFNTWFNKKQATEESFLKMRVFQYFIVTLTVVAVKSFTLNQLFGAIYAEGVGMLMIGFGMFSWVKKKDVWTGVFIALAILARQTLVLWILFFICDSLLKKQGVSRLPKVLIGVVVVGVIFICGVVYYGAGEAMFHNMVIFNISYAQAVANIKWKSLEMVIFSQPKIMVILLGSVWGMIYALRARLFDRYHWARIVVVGTIACSTVVIGGVVYDHHFYQLAPIIVFIGWVGLVIGPRANSILMVIMIGFSIVTLGISYNNFLHNGKYLADRDRTVVEILNEIIFEKKYYFFANYQPRYYFMLRAYAPDGNYHTFFLSKYFNPNDEYYRMKHAGLSKEIIKNTAVVLVGDSVNTLNYGEEYVAIFSDTFNYKQNLNIEKTNLILKVFESDL